MFYTENLWTIASENDCDKVVYKIHPSKKKQKTKKKPKTKQRTQFYLNANIILIPWKNLKMRCTF